MNPWFGMNKWRKGVTNAACKIMQIGERG